jgi:hypothetical protein
VPGVFVLALLASALDLPNRWATMAATLPVVRLWADPEAQYRRQLAPLPYDFLRQVDALVPRAAPVLLVTAGTAVKSEEYTLYHRALYFLAPRPVWWLAPVPPDGTWQARWWINAPLTADGVQALAAAKGATYVLAYRVDPPILLGRTLAAGDGSVLLQLDDSAPANSPPPLPVLPGPAWPLQLLAALAVIAAWGHLAVVGAARLGCRLHPVEAAGVAWVLGAGVVSLGMLWLGALGLNLPGQIAVLTAGALGWVLVWGSRSLRRPVPPDRPAPPRRAAAPGTGPSGAARLVAGACALFLVVQIGLTGLLALGRPLAVWDSWVNWAMKARLIVFHDGVSAALTADPSRAVTQLDYPLLVPLIEAWVYRWLGAFDDRLVAVPMVLFYVALIALYYGAVRRRGASRLLALGAATVVATLSNVAGLAGLGFAEPPLITALSVAAIYLLDWLDGGPPGALVLAAAGVGLLPWIKREGLLLGLALIGAMLLTHFGRRRAWGAVGALALGMALIAGPWWAFVAAQGIVNPSFGPLTLATLLANGERLGTILRLQAASLFSIGWSFLWPLTTVATPVLWWAHRRGPGPTAFLPVFLLLALALSGGLYFFSTFAPYEQHILSSIDRLIAPLTPLLVLWLTTWLPRVSSEQRAASDEWLVISD